MVQPQGAFFKQSRSIVNAEQISTFLEHYMSAIMMHARYIQGFIQRTILPQLPIDSIGRKSSKQIYIVNKQKVLNPTTLRLFEMMAKISYLSDVLLLQPTVDMCKEPGRHWAPRQLLSRRNRSPSVALIWRRSCLDHNIDPVFLPEHWPSISSWYGVEHCWLNHEFHQYTSIVLLGARYISLRRLLRSV